MAGPVVRVAPDRRAVRLLTLDVSTRTGWAVLDPHPVVSGSPGAEQMGDDALCELVAYGAVQNPKKIEEYGPYPWCYLAAAEAMAEQCLALYVKYDPHVVVIEETNGSKSRYTQKVLEMLHYAILKALQPVLQREVQVYYLSTADWRKTLGIQLTKEQKKTNARLAGAKRRARDKGVVLDKKKLGIRGRVGKKHLAVAWARQHFGLGLLEKHDDEAEALCLGVAYVSGCPLSTGQ